ncbi:MAG: response regulator [Gammaproteobacteria bacterium]|nr:response regulator [Gammaproteobacteria bacterium]
MTTLKPRVLIVDDKALTAHDLYPALSEIADIETMTAYPPLEILAGRKAPDVVVADTRIGDEDGFEFCRRVKASSRTGHIPVAFLTGSGRSFTALKEEAMDAGAF